MEAWLFLAWLALFLQGCPARETHYGLPWQVEVHCGSQRMSITVRRDLLGLGKMVEPTELTLGPEACRPSRLSAGRVVFDVVLQACGSVVQMTPDFLIYQTQLFYKPSLPSHPVIAHSRGATIGVECRYPRKDNVTSRALQPTWIPFKSTALRRAKLTFSLRLMNEDWTAERASGRFRLGEPLRLQADVRAEKRSPLRLWVDSCQASPGPASGRRYDIVGASGCLLDGRGEGVSSTFLVPRLRPETLRFTVDAFRFTEEAQKLVYLTCHLKVTPGDQPPDLSNKACSFDAGSHSWVSVEGPNALCGCCERRTCDGEGQDLQGSDGGARNGQRSLAGEETVAPQVDVTLGPLSVFDPERETDGAFISAAVEEMVMEELIAAVPTVTHPPFRGSSSISVDRKHRLGLPLEAFAQQGPLLFGGAQEGSGFGDPMEAVARSAPRKQQRGSLPQRAVALASTLAPWKPRLSGAERSALVTEAEGPSEDEDPNTTAKLPKEAVNLPAKDRTPPPENRPGWPLLLLPPLGATFTVLVSLGVWLLLRRRRRCRRASPVSLELQCK